MRTWNHLKRNFKYIYKIPKKDPLAIFTKSTEVSVVLCRILPLVLIWMLPVSLRSHLWSVWAQFAADWYHISNQKKWIFKDLTYLWLIWAKIYNGCILILNRKIFHEDTAFSLKDFVPTSESPLRRCIEISLNFYRTREECMPHTVCQYLMAGFFGSGKYSTAAKNRLFLANSDLNIYIFRE